jgi:hypothetical protein
MTKLLAALGLAAMAVSIVGASLAQPTGTKPLTGAIAGAASAIGSGNGAISAQRVARPCGAGQVQKTVCVQHARGINTCKRVCAAPGTPQLDPNHGA